ncbi:glycosyltransferase family 2 protein [Catenulispora pinisilvae]|uniref:glycosyltransferase family 2 protein n=1 Tax=Catenulispora pinisilvae TaxID=2705253 RepID=UPI0018917755|nr:glycosyltransferase family 2 protein [Catenulispora pinisilvae]
MNDRVAVIIPAYNSSGYIDQALASLVAQTQPADEVVVVDDGSGDDTYDRAARWTQHLPLHMVRLEQNAGIAAARSAAIERCSAELILQLDSDDVLLPHHIAAMTEQYTAAPGLIAPRELLLLEGGPVADLPMIKLDIPDPELQLPMMLVQNYLGIGCLYSRNAYEAVGGYRECGCAEDWDLWARFTVAGIPISVPPVPTYIYRMHASNISSNVDWRVVDIEILDRFIGELRQPENRIIAKLAAFQRAGWKRLDVLEPAASGYPARPDDGGPWNSVRTHLDSDLGEVRACEGPDGHSALIVEHPDRGVLLRMEGTPDHMSVTQIADSTWRWEDRGQQWWLGHTDLDHGDHDA